MKLKKVALLSLVNFLTKFKSIFRIIIIVSLELMELRWVVFGRKISRYLIALKMKETISWFFDYLHIFQNFDLKESFCLRKRYLETLETLMKNS